MEHSIFKKALRKSSVLVTIAALAACTSKAGHEDDKALAPQLNHAYVLIDQGKESEAVDLLIGLQKQGFTQKDVSVTLASAYVHRAGINIITLYKSFRSMDFDLAAREQVVLTKNAALFDLVKKHLKDPKLNDTIDQIVEVLAIVDLTVGDLKTLPTLNPAQQADLQTAFEIMSKTPDLNQGNYLFRAVIGLLLLKQVMFSSDTKDELASNASCHLPLEAIIDLVAKQLPLLLQTIGDVQKAYPKLASTLSPAADSLLAVQDQLNSDEFSLTLAQLKQYEDEGWLCAP